MNSLTGLPLPGFNARPLEEQDFYTICEREGITVLEWKVPTSFYMSCSGEKVIVLKQGERGLRRLFAAYHELGHHFLHGGEYDSISLFRGPRDSKDEIEADAFAAIALCPDVCLKDFEWLGRHSDDFAVRVWVIRNRIFREYGI